MAADLEPPELARLVDFAERPRIEDWSLRAALVRYAQPEPERVNTILDLVRRIEFALHQHAKELAREGPVVWERFAGSSEPGVDGQEFLDGLLATITPLDELGDELAAWAVTRDGDPAPSVDRATADVAGRLEALGVPHEERVRPPGRGRG